MALDRNSNLVVVIPVLVTGIHPSVDAGAR